MRKMVLLAVTAALTAMMLAAAPASAQVFFTSGDNDGDFCDDHHCDRDVICDLLDLDCDFDNVFVRDLDFADGIDQDVEQEAESGDVDQSFNVVGGGDNSNQTVGIQGTANTGNAQNAIGVTDTGAFGDFNNSFFRDGFFRDDEDCFRFHGRLICEDNGDNVILRDFNGDDELEIEDVNASINLSPMQTVTGNNQVNQAATAAG